VAKAQPSGLKALGYTLATFAVVFPAMILLYRLATG
jgi:hypothetical protein